MRLATRGAHASVAVCSRCIGENGLLHVCFLLDLEDWCGNTCSHVEDSLAAVAFDMAKRMIASPVDEPRLMATPAY